MSKFFQLVENNVVTNVILFDDASQMSGNAVATPGWPVYHPPAGGTLMDQPGAGVGWTWNGTALVAPLRTEPTRTKDQLVAFANAYQWSLASGGHSVTVSGTPHLFATDPDSLALMTGKVVRLMQSGAPTSVDWQLASGFVTFSAADFMGIATSIADWMQSTFDALPAVEAAIQSGAITTFAQVMAATWPTP